MPSRPSICWVRPSVSPASRGSSGRSGSMTTRRPPRAVSYLFDTEEHARKWGDDAAHVAGKTAWVSDIEARYFDVDERLSEIPTRTGDRRPPGLRSGPPHLDCEDPPRSGHALEVVFAALGQRPARPDNEVADRAADQHLVCCGQSAHARAYVNRKPADVVMREQFAFPGVQTRADLEAQVMDAVADRNRAADSAAGTIEHRERSVAERLDEPTAVALDLLAHQAVVAVKQ